MIHRYILTLATIAIVAAPAFSQAQERNETDRIYYTDTKLTDHRGEEVAFYTDLLKDKHVIAVTSYTTCAKECAFLLETIKSLTVHFEERMGKDLFVLLLLTDPDQPSGEQLADYARSLEVGNGWNIVGGSKDALDIVLKRIGLVPGDLPGQAQYINVGDMHNNKWQKYSAQTPPDELLAQVRSFLDPEK